MHLSELDKNLPGIIQTCKRLGGGDPGRNPTEFRPSEDVWEPTKSPRATTGKASKKTESFSRVWIPKELQAFFHASKTIKSCADRLSPCEFSANGDEMSGPGELGETGVREPLVVDQ